MTLAVEALQSTQLPGATVVVRCCPPDHWAASVTAPISPCRRLQVKHFRPFGEVLELSGVFAVSSAEERKAETERLGALRRPGRCVLCRPSHCGPLTLALLFLTFFLFLSGSAAEQRRALLNVWGFPEERPCFRMSVALDALSDSNNISGWLQPFLFCLSFRRPVPRPWLCCTLCHLPGNDYTGRLRNPHTSIKYKPLEGGRLELVKGDYDYYHYMQDKIDDNVSLYQACLCPCARARGVSLRFPIFIAQTRFASSLCPLPVVLGMRLQVAPVNLQLVQAAGVHHHGRSLPARDPRGVELAWVELWASSCHVRARS